MINHGATTKAQSNKTIVNLSVTLGKISFEREKQRRRETYAKVSIIADPQFIIKSCLTIGRTRVTEY